MSLSRVIKTGSHGGRSIDSFYFSSFHGKDERYTGATVEGFTPLFFGGESHAEQRGAVAPPVDEAAFEAVNAAEGMIVLSEEELASRIEESYAKGIEDERRQADDDLAGICSALTEAISIVSRMKERILKESEDELLKLSFVLAKKIIRQEIKQDRQIMAQVVSEAVREFPEQHDIVICLNPEDYRVISSNRELFLAGVGNDRQITLKPDDAMSVGGCVVESSTGIIDARIEAQLDEIYRSLVEERNILCDLPGSGSQGSLTGTEYTDEID